MKFKQKLKKVKQMFSDAWQCLVSKPRAFIINLIVPSQESTKSETTGRKRIRNCNHCGVVLVEGDNWAKSTVAKKNYICKKCNSANTQRNLKKRKGRKA